MAGKAYSAGTIFLQVVPVFDDVQRAIRREANDINSGLKGDMEKGGREAGRAAGKGLSEELGKSVDTKEVEARIGAFEKKMRSTFKRTADTMSDETNRALGGIRDQLDDLSDRKITPGLDSRQAERDALQLADKLARTFKNKKMTVEARAETAAAYKQLAPFLALVARLDGRKISTEVKTNAGLATAQLLAYSAAAKKAEKESHGLRQGAETTANSFRSFNAVLLSSAVLLPGLIPILGALAGGLLALLPILGAVGAGFGAMLVGFSGIGEALKGMSDVDKNAAKDGVSAAKKMSGAARSVADAERNLGRARQAAAQQSADAARSVASAREDAADRVQDALRSLADAERDYAAAQRDAQEAQENLRRARREAQQELEDAADRRRQIAVNERQAVIDLFNATVTEQAVRTDPGATNLEKEQASIDLEQARIRLKEIRDQEKEAAAEKRRFDKQGVNGTDTVRNAQDALTAALERQRDAQRAVGEAAREVQEARVDGAAQVADAIRQQDQTELSGRQSIADAQRNLRQAQEDYRAALVETGDLGSTSMQNLEYAMNKLSPAGQRFARFLYSLRGYFRDLRDGIQEAMLPGVEQGLRSIMGTYGPQFKAFAADMGGVMGRLFKQAGKGLGEEPWREFFGTYSKLAPRLLEEFGQTTGNWMGVYARLFTIAAPFAERLSKALKKLSENALAYMESGKGTKAWTDFFAYAERVAPMVIDFFKALWGVIKNLAIAMAPWGEMILQTVTRLLKFIAALDPKTLGFIVSSVIGLFIAFQLLTGVISLIGMGAIIAASTFGMVAFAVIAIGLALVAAYIYFEDFRKLVNTVAQDVWVVMKWLWANVFKPILKLIGIAFVLLVKGMLWWYENFWRPIFVAIGKVAKWLWENVLRPVFGWIGRRWREMMIGMKIIWDKVLKPVLSAIWSYIKFLWKYIFKPILGLIWGWWKFVFNAMKWAWKNILWPVLDMIFKILWKLFKLAFKPVFAAIKAGWQLLWRGIKAVWKNVGKPIFDFIVQEVLPRLKKAFKNAVENISNMWEGLQRLLAKPVRFIIDTIINKGLIGAFNWIARRVGSKEMKTVPLPDFAQKKSPPGYKPPRDRGALATGGIVPGYTPGRDVHDFYSPTGGLLSLSGGEPVMRPEFGRVVGSDWVDYWNAIARREGVSGIKKRMAQRGGAFALGGVWHPGPRSQRAGHGKSLDEAWDINSPGGTGTPVRAFLKGIITTVANLGGSSYGRYIKMNHPDYGLQSLYAHLSRQYVRPGQKVDRGFMIGREGSTGGSTGPHLHFELGGGQSTISKFVSGVGSVLSGILGKALGDPAKWLLGKAGDGLDKLTDKFGGNMWTKMGGNLVEEKVIPAMADKLSKMGSTVASGVSGFLGNISDAIKAGGVYAQVRAIATAYGWGSGSQWAALSKLINAESGWNPNADNPNSSAAGLFQKMTSIHGPVEKTAAGQAQWGLSYIRSRYKTPAAAWAFHQSHNYYADGGIIGDQSSGGGIPDNGAMMYDNGGYLPPGLTTVVNLTGRPEPVFTHEQFENFGRNGGGESFVYAPSFPGKDFSSQDVARDFEYTYRKVNRRGSRYAGTRD